MLVVCWIAGAGCSDKNSVPRGILPRDKMEEVMWDMAQADQYAVLYLSKDSGHIDQKAETLRLYEEVFRLHKITKEEFRKSYHYYLDHPELNQLLFDSVIARGSRARSELSERPSLYHGPVTSPMPGASVAATAGATAGMRGGVPMVPSLRNMRGIPNTPGAGRVPGVRPGLAVPGVVKPAVPGGGKAVVPGTGPGKRDTTRGKL
jgi:hypothetical protein